MPDTFKVLQSWHLVHSVPKFIFIKEKLELAMKWDRQVHMVV